MSQSLPQSACVLVQSEDGKLVLGVSRKDDKNAFGLPGGKVDPGETPEEAAERELLEETGFTVFDLHEVYAAPDAHGYYCVTFTGVALGEVNTEEEGRVAWLHPKEFIKGPFGDYIKNLFEVVGIDYRDPDLKPAWRKKPQVPQFE